MNYQLTRALSLVAVTVCCLGEAHGTTTTAEKIIGRTSGEFSWLAFDVPIEDAPVELNSGVFFSTLMKELFVPIVGQFVVPFSEKYFVDTVLLNSSRADILASFWKTPSFEIVTSTLRSIDQVIAKIAGNERNRGSFRLRLEGPVGWTGETKRTLWRATCDIRALRDGRGWTPLKSDPLSIEVDPHFGPVPFRNSSSGPLFDAHQDSDAHRGVAIVTFPKNPVDLGRMFPTVYNDAYVPEIDQTFISRAKDEQGEPGRETFFSGRSGHVVFVGQKAWHSAPAKRDYLTRVALVAN